MMSLKTCPKCNSEDVTNQIYFLDSKTGERNVPASTNSSSTITGVLLLLFGVGSTFVGIWLIPAIFSLGRFEGLFAFVVGLALVWNGVKTIRSKIKDKALEQFVEYTCKSCGNVWQKKNTPLKQPAYLVILPVVAGFLSCIVTAGIATQFDPSKLMIILLFGVIISCIVFYATRQWVKNKS